MLFNLEIALNLIFKKKRIIVVVIICKNNNRFDNKFSFLFIFSYYFKLKKVENA